MVRVFDPLVLWSASWRLSHNPEDGSKFLAGFCAKEGIAATREMAEEMLVKANDSLIAGTMGWIEIQAGEGYEASKKWVEEAKELQTARPELLLGLELYLSDKLRDYDKADVIKRILARDDLPMDFSRAALLGKAGMLLESHQLGQAEELAEKILAVEEQPFARWIKWVVAISSGSEESGSLHIKKMKDKWPGWMMLSMMALGWYYVGDIKQTMKIMLEAEKAGAKFEKIDNELVRLANSKEYQQMKSEGEQ